LVVVVDGSVCDSIAHSFHQLPGDLWHSRDHLFRQHLRILADAGHHRIGRVMALYFKEKPFMPFFNKDARNLNSFKDGIQDLAVGETHRTTASGTGRVIERDDDTSTRMFPPKSSSMSDANANSSNNPVSGLGSTRKSTSEP
jgi:hypothetical protein